MNKKKWYEYYSEKRIVHQWFQTKLLEKIDVKKVLEIGPGDGLSTAIMANAGYEVTTFDLTNKKPLGAVANIYGDLSKVNVNLLSGFDCIICCEVLEHFSFKDSIALLEKFHESNSSFLLVSVPYNEFQINFNIYINKNRIKKNSSFKFFNFLKYFKKQSLSKEGYPGHQWEIGYRNYPLKKLLNAVQDSGWKILNIDFTSGTRSVFILAQRN